MYFAHLTGIPMRALEKLPFNVKKILCRTNDLNNPLHAIVLWQGNRLIRFRSRTGSFVLLHLATGTAQYLNPRGSPLCRALFWHVHLIDTWRTRGDRKLQAGTFKDEFSNRIAIARKRGFELAGDAIPAQDKIATQVIYRRAFETTLDILPRHARLNGDIKNVGAGGHRAYFLDEAFVVLRLI